MCLLGLHWALQITASSGNCLLRVEQSVPEYNVRSTIFLIHCTIWDSVHSAVRSFTWSTILKSADPLAAFDRAIGEVVGRHVLTTVLSSRSGDKQWFDANCWRTYDAKQNTCCAWCTECNADHSGRFVLARAEAQRVYGATRGSHNGRTMNAMKHFTPSHR